MFDSVVLRCQSVILVFAVAIRSELMPALYQPLPPFLSLFFPFLSLLHHTCSRISLPQGRTQNLFFSFQNDHHHQLWPDWHQLPKTINMLRSVSLTFLITNKTNISPTVHSQSCADGLTQWFSTQGSGSQRVDGKKFPDSLFKVIMIYQYSVLTMWTYF